MDRFEKDIFEAIRALDKSGVLTSTIIGGSWAMYFYREIFENFQTTIITTDFDLFLPSVSKLKDGNITKVLTDLKFIRQDDYLTGKTSFYSEAGLTIEFLTVPDRTLCSVIKTKNEHIGVEALPKMAIAKWNYITVNFKGLNVNVPSPVSYCLQKLSINNERKEDKKIKDIASVRYILDFINASTKYRSEFIESYNVLPKKWKKLVDEAINKYQLITPIKK